MDHETFARRFREAAAASREVARFLVEEPLPRRLGFVLRVERTHQTIDLCSDESLQSPSEVLTRSSFLNEKEALALLWQDGSVPEWVNLRAVGVTPMVTLIEAHACDRFTANESLLYHQHQGMPPFQVLTPESAFDLSPTKRFSLYEQTVCSTKSQLTALSDHAEKIVRLELEGDASDDEGLELLPPLPDLTWMELRASPLRGPGLAALDRHPNLHWLRIDLDWPNAFEVPELPLLGTLRSFWATNLPPHDWGCRNLLRAIVSLDSLHLQASGDLFVAGAVPNDCDLLTLQGLNVAGDVHLPEQVDRLVINLTLASEHDIERLLRPIKRVRDIALGPTILPAAFLLELVSRFPDLQTLSAEGISASLKRDVAATRPGLCIRSRER